jgi:hypothetical protein
MVMIVGAQVLFHFHRSLVLLVTRLQQKEKLVKLAACCALQRTSGAMITDWKKKDFEREKVHCDTSQ